MDHDTSRRRLLMMAPAGAAAAAISRPSAASATSTATDTYADPVLTTMGTVGATPAETVRLSLVMYAENPAGWMLCNGFLSLITIAGTRVATTKFSIKSGHGAHLDWTPRGSLVRTQVYPLVTVTTDMTVGDYSGVVMGATLEVFDRKTLVTRTALCGVMKYAPAPVTAVAGG